MIFMQVISLECLLILCLVCRWVTSVDVKSLLGSKNDPPKLYLSSYVQADALQRKAAEDRFTTQSQFQNDFVSKNDTEYIVTDEVTQLVFNCIAAYPIKWVFPSIEKVPYHLLGLIVTSESRVSNFLPGSTQPTTSYYITNIVFVLSVVNFLSTNLTCASAEGLPQKESSVYIYLDGKSSLEHEGETIQISHNLNSKQRNSLIIPCRPSLPYLQLLLEMHYPVVQNAAWQPLTNWKFDPKIGFELPDIKNLGIENKSSSYLRCSVVENNADDSINRIENSAVRTYVHVNVTYTNSDSLETDLSSEFQTVSNIQGKASVNVVTTNPKRKNVHPATQIKCCSGVPQKPPFMFAKQCSNSLQCKLQRYSIPETLKQVELVNKKILTRQLIHKPNGCTNILVNFPSVYVICKGDNVDFRQHYTAVFELGSDGPLVNRSLRISTNAKNSHSTSLTKYVTTAENIGVAQKMALFVARPINGSLVLQSNGPKLGPPIWLLKQQNLAIIRSSIVNNAKHARNNLDQIVEYGRDTYYAGEPLLFLCVGVKVFYVRPIYISINWTNGTATVIKAESGLKQNKPAKVFYLSGGDSMFGGNFGSAEYGFSKPILAELEMKSVDCWMPVVESSKWDKISKPIKVLRSVPPLFQEPEEESVYLYLGDNEHVVSCTVLASLPQAIMSVYKNGKKLRLIWRKHGMNITEPSSKKLVGDTEFIDMNTDSITIRIKYTDVRYGDQGTVKCIATNVNITVTRTVHIYVVDKPNIALHISLSVVGILSLGIIGLGAMRLRYKRLAVN